MKVLHVHSGNLFGGIERVFVTLAAHRQTCPDMEPAFALAFDGRAAAELRAAGATVTILGAVRAARPWTVLRARRAMQALLAQTRADVVLCHSPWGNAVFGPAVRAADTPLALWHHGLLTPHHWIGWWAERTPADLTICNSQFTANNLSIRGKPISVVHPPVPAPAPDGSGAARRRLREEHAAGEAVVILHMSRMEPGKGHAVLLDALSDLRDVPNWVCWIAGAAQRPPERRYMDDLRRTARDRGLSERVMFLGEQPDAIACYAASDIYCQPNTAPDTFGLTFVESLYMSLPVVTSRIGGAIEILEDRWGVLVPPGDAVALAPALRRLLSDPVYRRGLADGGRARARSLCDPATQIPRLAECLARVARS